MKNLWICMFVVALGLTAQATPLDDKMKSFTDALKAENPDKSGANPMEAARFSNMAAELEIATQQGGEANLEARVRQILATDSTEAVQAAGKALLAELAARKKARIDATTTEVNAVLSRVPDLLGKAQKTQDLDGILGDLQKVRPQGGMYGYDSESQTLMNQVNSTYQFVSQWQDYLSARNNANTEGAQNTLRNLLNSRGQGEPVLVPRSEILARVEALPGHGKTPSPNGNSFAPPPAENEENAILEKIKTLDDIEPALDSFRTASIRGYNLDYLSQMAVSYGDAKNGLPIRLDFAPANYGNQPGAPGFERIKSMLLLYLLPRFIGSNALEFNPNETVTDYLKRSMETAEAKEDWPTLQRVIDAKLKISRAGDFPPGTHSFLSGLNQETAGQYSLAVTSYEQSLQQPDDFLPAKVVGDRLAAIKKDHSAEFDEGMKNFLSPPTPRYVPYPMPYAPMPGMPGYPGLMPGRAPVPAAAAPAAAAPAAPTPSPASTNAAPVAPPPPSPPNTHAAPASTPK